MKWYKFWTKRTRKGPKGSPDPQLLEMDFYCQLTYMAAIATSGISRSGLFHHAALLPYTSAGYFRKVNFVAKVFNHDYAESCRIVGEKTKELQIKALLLRLSGALATGEDIPNFLERESQILSESYGNSYERRLELLKKASDAYVALIMTSALVTVMSVVSMMIGNITIAFIVALASVTIVITIFGAWFIYRTAPREIKVHSLPNRSKEQNLAKIIVKFVLPIGGITTLILILMKVDMGLIMLVAGVCFLPLGLIGIIDDKKIDKRDADIAGFLRSLGGIAQAIGSTISEAMTRLDFRALGSLKGEVDLLYTRLLAGIVPSLCWDRFVSETGSELVNRTVRIFWDGVQLGGEPQRVGNEASSFATKIALLRAQRRQIASGFTWLTVVMHIVLTGLVIFIFQVLVTFANLITTLVQEEVEGITSSMPAFGGVISGGSMYMDLLYFMIIMIVIVLTFANAVAIYAMGGGHIYKLVLYLALMLTISGATVGLVPPAVNMIFSTIG